MADRIGLVERKTAETAIVVRINLDGSGQSKINTPLPFLSHMLEQISRHGGFDLEIEASGDVEIDGHHTTEDLGIVLGKAVLQALGDRKGIQRYGAATHRLVPELFFRQVIDQPVEQVAAHPVARGEQIAG